MHDNAAAVDTRRPAGAEGLFGRQPPKKADDESASCLAYSYLRALTSTLYVVDGLR